jgi:ribosomal protein L31
VDFPQKIYTDEMKDVVFGHEMHIRPRSFNSSIRIDEKGNPQKISKHDTNMYNISETKKSDGTINLAIKNERSGKTYNVTNIKSMDGDIIESFQSSHVGKTDISQSNAIGKLEHTAYAREDDAFIINNMSTNRTDIVQLGHFDDDGSKSSFNHSYSVYAEVTTDNGDIIKCYSSKDFNEAVSGSTKYSVDIKRETHPFWSTNTIETLNTYDNSIELGRLNRAFINTDYVSGKATHSKVD